MAKKKSPFTPAKRVKQYLKLVVSGDTDAGKTHFGLTAPSPYIIDMEGNASLFSGRSYHRKVTEETSHRRIDRDTAEVPFDFHILETRSFRETEKAVDYMLANPDPNGTLVVDNGSLLWEACQEGYITKLERKVNDGRSNREDPDELQFGDWRHIKRPWKDLMRKLFNLPMHVILLCRIEDDIKVIDGKPVTQGKKLDTEKRTKYFGTIHLHLEVSDDGNRTGIVIRDKWGVYNHGDTIENPTFWTFESLLAHAPNNGEQPQQESDEELAEKDGESFDNERDDLKEKTLVIAKITKAGKVMFSTFGQRGREAYNEKIESIQKDGTLKELPLDTLNTTLDELYTTHGELKATAPSNSNSDPVEEGEDKEIDFEFHTAD